jgi:hypothetical protein
MATFEELAILAPRGTPESDELFARIVVAVCMVANTVSLENPGTAARRMWASQAFGDRYGAAEKMWPKLLAVARNSTIAQILAVPDATIEAAVLAAVDTFAQQAV